MSQNENQDVQQPPQATENQEAPVGGRTHMEWSKISTDCRDPKKAFDEIALARCAAMATESLHPQAFDAFIFAHNLLLKVRGLGNNRIF